MLPASIQGLKLKALIPEGSIWGRGQNVGGRLVVMTWDGEGQVYRINGVIDGDAGTRLVAKAIAKAINDEVFVLQKHKLSQLSDLDGDGMMDEYHVVANDLAFAIFKTALVEAVPLDWHRCRRSPSALLVANCALPRGPCLWYFSYGGVSRAERLTNLNAGRNGPALPSSTNESAYGLTSSSSSVAVITMKMTRIAPARMPSKQQHHWSIDSPVWNRLPCP